MSNVLNRLLREPNALVGFVIALLGLLVLFHVPLTKEQVGGIVTLLGALVVLIRQLVTPAGEVVAKRRRGRPHVVAGPASSLPTGTPVKVTTQAAA